jgi:hypothetical protein
MTETLSETLGIGCLPYRKCSVRNGHPDGGDVDIAADAGLWVYFRERAK